VNKLVPLDEFIDQYTEEETEKITRQI